MSWRSRLRLTFRSRRTASPPLNSSVEAVEKPLLGKLIAKQGKSDLTERSTIDAQPVGKGSSIP